MSEAMMWLLVRGVWETLAMTFVSGFFGFVIGLPVGVLLYVTRPGQIMENARLYRSLSAVVNIFRSIPFIILLVWMIPFTRIIVGTSIGLQAAIVPLTVGAARRRSRSNRLSVRLYWIQCYRDEYGAGITCRSGLFNSVIRRSHRQGCHA